MRAGLTLSLLVAGCTSGTDHPLPSATFTPHLDSQTTTVACGDDIALYGATSPDLRYRYTYDPAGQLVHATGAYAAGGTDDAIDYTYDATGNMTHLLETRGWGDARVEIAAGYDATNGLVDYTYDVTAPDYHDAWHYTLSDFVGPGQPGRETVTEAGQPALGYQLAYDAMNRLVQAAPDSGPATTYTYDDVARTITMDTGNGAWHGVYLYDDQDRALSETWGGTDPSAWASETDYAWTGDRLDSMTYSSGTEQAPQQLALVETDTLRYDCASARTNRARAVRFVKPAARR